MTATRTHAAEVAGGETGRSAVTAQPPLVQDEAWAQAVELHKEAVVYDGTAPLFPALGPRAVDEYLAGGVSLIATTAYDMAAHGVSGAENGLHGLKYNRRLIAEDPERLRLVQTVADVHAAKSAGQLGVILHWQNAIYFDRDPGLVEPFAALGLRIVQLTYNVRNNVGDGCTEPANGGLSRFGQTLVKELVSGGILVDGSHTAERTTLEAAEIVGGMGKPFVFTHSGCSSVFEHVRNISDDQIRAAAATGGLVGVLGLPYFIGPAQDPTIEQIVRHVAHVVELVGIDHVGIGMDYWHGVTPYMSEQDQLALRRADDPTWRPGDIPFGAWSYAPGIETPAGMRNLTAGLLRHGFSVGEVRKILGENYLRVFSESWVGGSA